MNVNLFKEDKSFVIGMVHLKALPGTVGFKGDMKSIIQKGIEDAKKIEEAGFSAIMVENFGDMPYKVNLDLEQTAALAAATAVIKREVNIPVGIDAAFNDYKSGLAIAKAAGADFIRIPVFIDTVEYFGGIVTPCATKALQYRKQIEAEEVNIFADIQVKHSHMLISNIPIEESAKVAESCGADALIVTGTQTGEETPIEMIKRVKNVVSIPVLTGSGTNKDNIREQMNIANGAIIGTSIKVDNNVWNEVDLNKAKEIIENL